MADPQDEFESAFAQAGAELAVKQGTATPPQAEQPPDDAAGSPAPQAPATPIENSAPAGNEQVSADELKRQLDQAIHRERSSAARVSAFQKEKDRLLAELQQAKDAMAKAAQAPAPDTQTPAPARDDVLSNAPDLEQAVSLRINEAMEQANKAVAEANARAEAAIKAADDLRLSVDPLVSRRQEESRTETWRALDERFNGYDWRGDLKTAEFDAWLADAPDPVKQMFEKGQTVKESAAVLSLFYSATGKKPAAPAANEARANPNQERLRQSAGIAPRGGQRQQPSGPAEDDFEGNFAAAAKALKQA